MRLHELRDRLAEILALHALAADRHVSKLRAAGLLPDRLSASVDVEHLARLLIGVMAARAATETADAVAVFEQTELLIVEARDQAPDGSATISLLPLESVPDQWRSFLPAVAFGLDNRMITEILVRRNRSEPVAILLIKADETGRVLRLCYGLPQSPSGLFHAIDKIALGYLDLWAVLSSVAIQKIEALFSDAPPPALPDQPELTVH